MSHKCSYDAIGNSTTAATLTATYTGNTKTLFCRGLEKLTLNAKYTPKTGQTDRVMYVKVEVSEDGTNFFDRSGITNSTTQSKVYENIEFQLPGDGTSTGGTAISQTWNDIDVVGDWVKISVIESGSANFGTAWINAVLTGDA